MNIFYIGNDDSFSTALHRYSALKRIGHQVKIYNPVNPIKKILANKFFSKFHYLTGYGYLQKSILAGLKSYVYQNNITPDLVWVDSGELLSKKCLEFLKTLNGKIVLYNLDSPTSRRDGNRFKMLLTGLKLYDLVVVVKEETYKDCLKLGLKNVLKVYRSYDEEFHKPFDNVNDISALYKSDVCFVGTWMTSEYRDEFLLALINKGIQVSIWGNRWEKSKHYNQLSKYHKGGGLGGRDYVAAIQGAKICIGLLSKGNSDLHTQRSLEIPFIGGLLCAERTSEHVELYKDGQEAIFWDDVEECARLCKKLLANDEAINAIKKAGTLKVRSLEVGNEDICKKIIAHLCRN